MWMGADIGHEQRERASDSCREAFLKLPGVAPNIGALSPTYGY